MIEWIRKASESWVARGFFLFLAVAFGIMWGGGDLARRVGLGDPTVATVGKIKISASQLQLALGRHINQLQMRYNENIDQEKARKLGLHKLVLQNLVNDKLIEQEAGRLRIHVTDDYVRKVIKKDKNFSDGSGQFSRDRFKFLIARIGFTEEGYIDTLRREMVKERLFQGMTQGVIAPLTLTYPLYVWQNETRNLTVLTLKTSSQKVAEQPSEDALRTFYGENDRLFLAPEHRDITAVMLDTANVIKTIKISEEDLKEAFTNRGEDFEGKTFQDVKAELEKDLKQQKVSDALYNLSVKIEDEIAGGSTLEDAAKQYELQVLTFKSVNIKGIPDPYSGQAPLVAPRKEEELTLIREAFRQEQGIPGAMIEASAGNYFIARVDQITKAHKRPFSTVKEKVVELWTQRKQFELAGEVAKQISKEINDGAYVAAVANRYKLPLARVSIDRRKVLAPSALVLPEKFIARLFELPKGKASFALTEGDKKNPFNFQIAIVQGIQKGDPKNDPKDVKKFQGHLKNLLKEDLLAQYVFSLRKRFPIEINKKFFAQLEQS